MATGENYKQAPTPCRPRGRYARSHGAIECPRTELIYNPTLKFATELQLE